MTPLIEGNDLHRFWTNVLLTTEPAAGGERAVAMPNLRGHHGGISNGTYAKTLAKDPFSAIFALTQMSTVVKLATFFGCGASAERLLYRGFDGDRPHEIASPGRVSF